MCNWGVFVKGLFDSKIWIKKYLYIWLNSQNGLFYSTLPLVVLPLVYSFGIPFNLKNIRKAFALQKWCKKAWQQTSTMHTYHRKTIQRHEANHSKNLTILENTIRFFKKNCYKSGHHKLDPCGVQHANYFKNLDKYPIFKYPLTTPRLQKYIITSNHRGLVQHGPDLDPPSPRGASLWWKLEASPASHSLA